VTVDSQTDSKARSGGSGKSIFSAEERREVVASFCKAFLSGKLRVLSWTQGVVVDISTGKKTPREELFFTKKTFTNTLAVACGMGGGTQEQIDRAVEEIFGALLAWRGGGLIEGEFATFDQEAKLKALESRVESLEKLMLQLIEEVRMLSHVRGSNPP